MKMKIVLFLLFGIFAGTVLYAQTITPNVISSSGGYFTSATSSLSATVAEMTMVNTFQSTNNFLTQGFQQPADWFTNIEEEIPDGTISIFPNPSDGRFNVLISIQGNANVKLKIFDMMSQLIYQQEFDKAGGDLLKSVNIRDFSSGIYFIHFLCSPENSKEQQKIIKINIVK